MRVGVVSDSHGYRDNLGDAARKIVEDEEAEVIVHLGDDYDDTEVLEQFGVKIIKIPGVFSDYYQDRAIPNRLVEEFEGWKVLISHTESSHENDLADDLVPEEIIERGEVDVLLHGHKHKPNIEEKGGVIRINPGHLKDEDKKGSPPSFAVIDFEKKKLRAKIIGLFKDDEITSAEFNKKG